MINQRLFDHYGIETTKHLGIGKICPRPYDTVLIDKRGSCYACECTSWLPQSIGNLQVKSLNEILAGSTRQHLQDSVTDGSYRYCNNAQCPWLMSNDLRYFHKDRPSPKVRHIRLAIDDSCNLRCPSCRKGMIFHKEGPTLRSSIKLADKINEWLQTQRHPIQVHIGSDGDPFASHVYRHFMQETPRAKNISYSILTNGLMFKEFHAQIPHVMSNLTKLGVSMDGASAATYEKLRLGGKWDKIIENLEHIASLKSRHGFEFGLQFVIQKDNYREMSDIIELAAKYQVDRLWLNKIEDWQVMDNWNDQNIFNELHPLHKDFVKEFEKVIPVLNREDRRPIVEAPQLHVRSY